MCGVQREDENRCKDLMLMLGRNETIDHLVMVNSIHRYGYVFKREDGHVLRRALDFEVDGQMKKRRLKRPWKKRLRKKV